MSFYRGYAAFLFLVAACIQSLSTANGKQYYKIWLKHERGSDKGTYTALAVEEKSSCYLAYTNPKGWACQSAGEVDEVTENDEEKRVLINPMAYQYSFLTYYKGNEVKQGQAGIYANNDSVEIKRSFFRRKVYFTHGNHKVSVQLRKAVRRYSEKSPLVGVDLTFFKAGHGASQSEQFQGCINVPSEPILTPPVFEIDEFNGEWKVQPAAARTPDRSRGLAILSNTDPHIFEVRRLQYPAAAETIAILLPKQGLSCRWTWFTKRFVVKGGHNTLETARGVPFTIPREDRVCPETDAVDEPQRNQEGQ